jgi:hypothetical protein
MQTKNHNVQQGTPEWFTLRLGRLTASEAQAIATDGKGLETLCIRLAAERLTGLPAEKWEGNADTERGKELEAEARSLYARTHDDIEEVGFIEYGDYAGCSPDGLVSFDGGMEIKSPNDVRFLDVCLTGKIDTGYIWQVQMNLLITGREWWDFIAYNPHFKNPLYIQRITPDMKKHQALLAGIESGTKKIQAIIAKMEAAQ